MAKIEIYTTPYCPYCMMAKSLLDDKKAAFDETDVSNAADRQDMMLRAHGRRTVPQIFINDKHIGGFDDLSALDRRGKLDPLLAEDAA